MFLVIYDGAVDSLFFDVLDAEQYLQLFSEDQQKFFELIELDDHRSSVIASIAVDVHDNYKFCKATGLIE